MGLGQRLRLDTIDQRIARYPLRRVLALLAQIAFRADQAIRNKEKRLKLARALFPDRVVSRAIERLESDDAAVPVSSRVVLNLALRALVNCPDGESLFSGTDDELAHELGTLLLALADHADLEVDDEELLTLELVRFDLYFRLNDVSAWYEVSNRLLFEVLPSMSDDHDYVDADKVISSVYEIDLELFWALTVAYGVSSSTDPDSFVLPRPFSGGTVTDEEIEKWASAWFSDLSDSIAKARDDLATGSWWVFTAFFDRPLIRLDSKGVVPRPAFLAYKASPPGMFWAVRDAFVASGGSHQQWAQLFGRAIEKLGRLLLSEHLAGRKVLWNEDEIRDRWGAGASCDVVILGTEWISIDFVYRQFTKATTALGNFDDLLLDLKRAAVGKFGQIDETLRRGLEVESVSPELMVPIVVTGAPFPVKPPLLEHIERLIAESSPEVIGVDERCMKPIVMDLSELFLILHATAFTGQSLVDLLKAWQSSSLSADSFRNWFVTSGLGPKMIDAKAVSATWQERVQQRLFHR